MKTSMKKWLIIIALAFIVCFGILVALRLRPDDPDELVGETVSETSGDPSFAVRVIMPRTGLPLGGILPDFLVRKLDGTPRELRFDNTSPGAQVGNVAPDRVELRADGWDLSIETDGEGRVAAGTRLVFGLGLGGRQVTLRCRPAVPSIGRLRTTPRAGSDGIDGRFRIELANCENVESGKATNWPPAPLTVSGSFAALGKAPNQ